MNSNITLMAAGELRDAVSAAQRGDTAAAVYGLMSIDADSWAAIENRLSVLGGSIAALIAPQDAR